MSKTYIRNFHQKIIGSLETLPNGDVIVRDFYQRILGKYQKSDNTTRDFYGRIVARGNQASMLLNLNNNK